MRGGRTGAKRLVVKICQIEPNSGRDSTPEATSWQLWGEVSATQLELRSSPRSSGVTFCHAWRATFLQPPGCPSRSLAPGWRARHAALAARLRAAAAAARNARREPMPCARAVRAGACGKDGPIALGQTHSLVGCICAVACRGHGRGWASCAAASRRRGVVAARSGKSWQSDGHERVVDVLCCVPHAGLQQAWAGCLPRVVRRNAATCPSRWRGREGETHSTSNPCGMPQARLSRPCVFLVRMKQVEGQAACRAQVVSVRVSPESVVSLLSRPYSGKSDIDRHRRLGRGEVAEGRRPLADPLGHIMSVSSQKTCSPKAIAPRYGDYPFS